MTTFLILLVLAFLSSWKTLGLDHIVVTILGLPSLYYQVAMVAVILGRLCLAAYRAYRKVAPALSRFNSVITRLSNDGGLTPPSGTSLKGNGTRKFSTSSRARNASIPNVSESSNPPSLNKRNPLLKRWKVTDTFFRTIAKKGTLVSLLGGKARKGLPSLANLFNKIGFRIFGAVFTAKGKYLSRMRQLNAFRVHLLNKTRNHGPVYTVKYLKAMTLAIQKAIAGTPVGSLRELEPTLPMERVTNQGLPKWIPLRDRRLILINHSSSVIRWYLTLTSVYRVISIPGQLKISTITDPLTVAKESIVRVAENIIYIINPDQFDTSILFEHSKPALLGINLKGNPKIDLLEAASATSKISWLGLISDIMCLRVHGVLDHLIAYMVATNQLKLAKLAAHLNEFSFSAEKITTITGMKLLGIPNVGRLAFKSEPAGKIRVFAMATIWDQTALKPLHDMLFKWLRGLPNDGTFNQDASVRRCQDKSVLTNNSFGYDLSAATDRLPISLQSSILSRIVPGLGPIWARLLTSRDYLLPKPKPGYGYTEDQREIQYTVGQPMGALSSWAMLAVTHHYIAQYAAFLARLSGTLDPHGFWDRNDWYTGYEVLGDDIVFFERDVAHQYLLLMDQLGVPINLAKSVIATNATFEFAKVTGHNGMHVAAISWAMFMAQPTAMGRVGILYSLIRKGIVKSHFVRYINTFARESKYTPGLPNIFYLALGTMYANKGRLKFSDLFGAILSHEGGVISLLDSSAKSMTALAKAIAVTAASPDSRETVRIEHSSKIEAIADLNVSDLSLKTALVKTIKVFVYGAPTNTDVRTNYLDPARDAEKLARAVVLSMTNLTSEARAVNSARWEAQGVFNLRPSPSRVMDADANLVHPVFALLYAQFFEFFQRKWEILTAIKPLKLKGLSINELFDLIDHIDRYKEQLDIVNRATEKLIKSISKEPDPARLKNLVENPLDVLKRVLKSESDLESMRRVVVSAGVEVITKIFARGDTASYSMFSEVAEDNPGYKGPAPHVPLDAIKRYITEFGDEFVTTHLPKWGKYAGYMFKEPSDDKEFIPYNPLAAQHIYLYCITLLDDLYPTENLDAFVKESEISAGEESIPDLIQEFRSGLSQKGEGS